MVLMRRKDKRRGNEADEIVVASDSSIVANKGVRSLQSARTGRFAADMRVQIGGYGRADKTWGVDHPWHKTREDILEELTSRDHMEEGHRVKEEEKKTGQGLSRAALKKKKAKMKKGGLAGSSAGSEIGSEAVSMTESRLSSGEGAAVTEQKADRGVAPKELQREATEKESDRDAPVQESVGEQSVTEGEGKNKKRKRVNRNKKKKEKAQSVADSDESDLDESVEVAAKAKKQKAAADDAQPAQVVASDVDKKRKQEDSAKREAIAKQYETAMGQEFTTASGLTIRDIRVGSGRVPAIGDMITVRYRGRIGDKNGIVFGKGILPTTYGTGSVIAGWEECMGTMRAGGVRHLTVPPGLGYGVVAKGAKIPANSTLFFEIEFIRLGKRKRDAVAKDEVPLPSSFQRKKTPTASASKITAKKGKGKARRRKYSI